jgi:hypothetical protein
MIASPRLARWRKSHLVHCLCTLLLAAACSTCTLAQSGIPQDASLRRQFADPPTSAKLRCYWWWLNGQTTEETITRDLTEMSRKGFGGVLLVDANGASQGGNENVPPGPRFGSPAWTKLYLHALKIASQRHLEVTLNATSGWNLGGPDVKPEQAAKLLTWTRTIIKAGQPFDGNLPMPPIKNGFYRQIAVLAYPLHHGDLLPGSKTDLRAPLKLLNFKSASVEVGGSMPATDMLLGNDDQAPGQEDTDLQDVVDISGQVDTTGRTSWRPSSGTSWEILRVGYTDSDARVSTSSETWQGLAIDYLDRGAFDTYWDNTLAPLLEASRPYLQNTLISLATDSWELGGTNWTARFADEFRKRRGYDPIRYLPVVAGRIVQNRTTSNNFLNDLRRTAGDLVTDHYDHFAERAKAYGIGIQCESGGPHGAPIDALETFRSSAIPQTEYWAQSNEHRTADKDRFFAKESASAADIYGKPFAADEGMTTIGPQWDESLATDLKPTFDRALTEGMNRLIWHTFTSSPERFGLPGIQYFAGTHLNQNVTWWEQGDAFFRYLNRSQLLLQQGHAVDDVLYFYGDQVPNFVRLKSDDPARVLPGYDYDVTNEDALLHSLKVRNGVLMSPTGNVYRLLVMPQGRRLNLASLERVAEYVHAGVSLAGQPPLGPTGNVDAAARQRFSQLVEDLWGECKEVHHRYGAGMVSCSADGRAVLRGMNIAPDFEDSTGHLDYVHRATSAMDIYFVRNGGSEPVDTIASFRVTGRIPELWNAVEGTITPQLFYDIGEHSTTVPLHLGPYGSTFVIFEHSTRVHATHVMRNSDEASFVDLKQMAGGNFTLTSADEGAYKIHLSDGRDLTGYVPPAQSIDLPANKWTIAFQSGREAPVGPQPLTSFQSWTESPDPGVRYFSGTATYRTEFDARPAGDQHVLLTLGDLHEICTVRVNGKVAGTIWAKPYQLEITGSLIAGRNTVELEVTNLWPNRLIGDAQPTAIRKYTRTNIRKYKADSPLLPSGVIGPVTLVTQQTVSLHSDGRAKSE